MYLYFLVAVGGALGSVCRFAISNIIKEYFSTTFPLSTFIVNVLGCFIFGFIYGIIQKQDISSNNLSSLLLVGFCGGFTTFSSFCLDGVNLLNINNYFIFILYITLSVLLGFISLFLGVKLSLFTY